MKTFAYVTTIALISTSAFSATPNTPSMSKATAEMHMAMKSMCENMDKMPVSADVNQEFVKMMIPHHQAAVDMANAYLQEGSDPQIIGLAKNIIESQRKEIEAMKIWLETKDDSSEASAID